MKLEFRAMSLSSRGIRERSVSPDGIILEVRPVRPNEQFPADRQKLANSALSAKQQLDVVRVLKSHSGVTGGAAIATFLAPRGQGLEPHPCVGC